MLLVTDPEQDSNEEQESGFVAVYRQVREVQRREAFGVGKVITEEHEEHSPEPCSITCA
jgi:hypothetical protein